MTILPGLIAIWHAVHITNYVVIEFSILIAYLLPIDKDICSPFNNIPYQKWKRIQFNNSQSEWYHHFLQYLMFSNWVAHLYLLNILIPVSLLLVWARSTFLMLDEFPFLRVHAIIIQIISVHIRHLNIVAVLDCI